MGSSPTPLAIRKDAQLYAHRLGWMVLAAILGFASCTAGHAAQPSVTAEWRTPTQEASDEATPVGTFISVDGAVPVELLDTLWAGAPATSTLVAEDTLPTLPPAPPRLAAQAEAAVAGRLSEAEMRAVLLDAGWPESLVPQALSVACGIGNPRWPNGESTCIPTKENGKYKGLFQLETPFWFNWCGLDPAMWSDPHTNAQCAYLLYQSSGWGPWDVQP